MNGFYREKRHKLRGYPVFGFDYEEEKHKRDEGGKWATKEGTGGGSGRYETTEEWAETLSGTEMERALFSYVGGGWADMRDLHSGRLARSPKEKEAQETSDALDAALASAPVFPDEVFRGMHDLDEVDVDVVGTVGDTISFGSFTSTSQDEFDALQFTRSEHGDPDSHSVLFRILPGHQGADIAEFRGDETEVLLPRNSEFKVAKRTLLEKEFEEEPNTWEIVLDPVPRSG